MTEYRIYSIDKATGERDYLDFTFDYDEAVRWVGEYAAEDEAARANGVCQAYYDYEIVEAVDEEDEDD